MAIKIIKRNSQVKAQPAQPKVSTAEIVKSWVTDTQARKMQEQVEAREFWGLETASVYRSSAARGVEIMRIKTLLGIALLAIVCYNVVTAMMDAQKHFAKLDEIRRIK